MNIVRDFSILQSVKEGRYKGRLCRVSQYFFANTNMDSIAHVVFADSDHNETGTVMAVNLTPIESPGWALTEREYGRRCSSCYGLEEWFAKETGNGSNLLRTTDLAQPKALRIGDRLALGETIEKIRVGYNDSVIIRISHYGWIELAPRLPIALLGNRNFSLPQCLLKNETLATGCLIFENPTEIIGKDDWINVNLDRKGIDIEVPFCAPLALA